MAADKKKPTGTAFEDHVALVCEAYRLTQRAYLEKVEPPTKVVRAGGFTKVVQLKNPFLDFMGVWKEHGNRAIHLEAKSTTTPRLPVCRDPGVTAEQLAAMEMWWSNGAAVGVLWEHGPEVRFVTLGMLLEARDNDERVSVPWSRAYPIPKGTSAVVAFDFLAVMAKIYPCKAS